MKTKIMQDLLFPPNQSFKGTLIVEIPDISDQEGRFIIAEMNDKFPEKSLKFEVKSAKEEEIQGTTPDLS